MVQRLTKNKTMVSKKTIKEYGFESLVDYFDYIIESKINGQRSQTIELFNDLSKSQKMDFYKHIGNSLVEFLDYIKK